MKSLFVLAILLCISTAYSFMCYECTPEKEGEDYTTEQCEKDQKKVNCTGDGYTCFKVHVERTDGVVQEARGCGEKTGCESSKKTCGDDDLKKLANIKECQAACCVSDGDTPCNSGFIVSADMIVMMVAVLSSLKLF